MYQPYHPKRRTRWLLFGLLFLLTGLQAQASHFRSGNISWKRINGSSNQIEFTVSQAWRTDAFTDLRVGSVISTGTSLNTGMHNVPVNLTVTSINTDDNWFYGTFIYNEKSYALNGTYTASITNCCRLDALFNNDNANFRISTVVDLSADKNNSPVSTIPAYINLPANSLEATYRIPAFDMDGDSLTFTLTPADSFGLGTVQPEGLSITTDGLLTFNTLSKLPGSLWNTSVTIEDGNGASIQLDFLINLTAATTPPYFDYSVTPGNNATYTVYPGQTIAFDVSATDNDNGDIVSLNAVGLPIGASFTPGSGSSVTRTFSWMPTGANLGNTYQVNFVAQDNQQAQALSTVTILVVTKPVFRGPSPLANSAFCVQPGDTISNTLVAGGNSQTKFSLVSGPSAGLSFSPALPTNWQNTATTTFTYVPPAGTWGVQQLVVKALNQQNAYDLDTIQFVVNNPPVITSAPVTSVTAGQIYNYTLTATDPDITAGDHIHLDEASLPSFLTATDQGNGNVLITSTFPLTALQAGSYTINITLHDDLGHAAGTHCSNVTQSYTLDITGCTSPASVSISASASNDFCNATVLTANAAGTGVTTYAWTYNGQLKGITPTLKLELDDPDGCYKLKVTRNGCPSKEARYFYLRSLRLNNYGIVGYNGVTLGANNTVYNAAVGVRNSGGVFQMGTGSTVNSPGAFVIANKIYRPSGVSAPNRYFLPAFWFYFFLPPMQYNTSSTSSLVNATVTTNTTLTGNKKDVLVKAGKQVTLTGTIFGKITLEKKARVTFSQATVNVADIVMLDSSQLRFQTATAVRATGTILINKGCKVNPTGYKVTFYLGDNSGDDEKFTITGGDVNFIGNVYVPVGDISISGATNLPVNVTGQFIGETITSGTKVNWYTYNCSAPPSFPARMMGTEEEEQGLFEFYASPNPAVSDFEFRVDADDITPVSYRILDITGRTVASMTVTDFRNPVHMGGTLPAGTYMAEAVQGYRRKIVKVIKLN